MCFGNKQVEVSDVVGRVVGLYFMEGQVHVYTFKLISQERFCEAKALSSQSADRKG